jgi:hypothetical protein
VTWIAEFSVTGGDAAVLGQGVREGVLDLGIEGLRAAALVTWKGSLALSLLSVRSRGSIRER